MKRIVFLLFVACFAGGVFAQEAQRGILVTDMLRIKRAGAVELSPDGTHVIYTVQSIIPDEKNPLDHRYQSQLWMADVAGTSEPRPLTAGREGFSQASFSPDGQSIVFARSVD